MYDRGKDLNWKMFKDVQFIAAMGKVRIVNVGEYTHVHTYIHTGYTHVHVHTLYMYVHTYLHTCTYMYLLEVA